MEVLERGNLFFMIILEYVSLVSRNINIKWKCVHAFFRGNQILYFGVQKIRKNCISDAIILK